jgi:hypothetical protein
MHMPANNFNAGVMSLTPSEDTSNALLNLTTTHPLGWDAEQGLLNSFFPAPSPDHVYPSRYTRTVLPMKYNLNLAALHHHQQQWDDVWPDVRIVHFTIAKPSSKECKTEEQCLYPQPLNAWRNEFLEMRRKYGWDTLETRT